MLGVSAGGHSVRDPGSHPPFSWANLRAGRSLHAEPSTERAASEESNSRVRVADITLGPLSAAPPGPSPTHEVAIPPPGGSFSPPRQGPRRQRQDLRREHAQHDMAVAARRRRAHPRAALEALAAGSRRAGRAHGLLPNRGPQLHPAQPPSLWRVLGGAHPELTPGRAGARVPGVHVRRRREGEAVRGVRGLRLQVPGRAHRAHGPLEGREGLPLRVRRAGRHAGHERTLQPRRSRPGEPPKSPACAGWARR